MSTVRNKLTPYSGPTPDTTWQLTWKPSSTLTLQFLEDALYTGTFDGRYKDARKSSLEIADFMNYQSVADKVLEIKDAITNGKSGGEAGGASGDANVTAPAVVDPAAPINQQTSLAVSFKQLSETEQETWTKHMQKMLSGTIRLLVDDGTTAQLKTAIQSTPLAMTRGDPTGLILFHYDIKKHGESTTRPDLRVSPIRECYSRLVKAILDARKPISSTPDDDDEAEEKGSLLQPGEMAIIFDGGKRGNKSRLLQPWLPMSKKGVRINKHASFE